MTSCLGFDYDQGSLKISQIFLVKLSKEAFLTNRQLTLSGSVEWFVSCPYLISHKSHFFDTKNSYIAHRVFSDLISQISEILFSKILPPSWLCELVVSISQNAQTTRTTILNTCCMCAELRKLYATNFLFFCLKFSTNQNMISSLQSISRSKHFVQIYRFCFL